MDKALDCGSRDWRFDSSRAHNFLFIKLERYRSGHTGLASKAMLGEISTWVRIPPSPPSSRCSSASARFVRCLCSLKDRAPASGAGYTGSIPVRGTYLKNYFLILFHPQFFCVYFTFWIIQNFMFIANS